MAKRTYRGRGKVYLDGRHIGNVSELVLNSENREETMLDYTQGGGGVYDSVSEIEQATFAFTFWDYFPENFAVSTFGTSASVAAGTVTDESISAPADLADGDRLVKTAKMIDTTQTVTVTSDPAGTTYTLDTDYSVTKAGIILLSAGSISASDPLLVSYSNEATDLVQAIMTSGQEFNMVFDGLNDADSGKGVVVDIFKAKPSPGEGIGLISEEFASSTVNGTIVKDTTKNGTTESQYYTVEMEQ